MQRADGELGVGDRLKEGPAPELIASAFTLECSYGPRLAQGMSFADLAHALVLLESALIPEQPGRELLRALLELHAIDDIAFDPRHGDAYTNREHWLRQRVPDAVGWLQAGRARREASTIGYTLALRSGLLAVIQAHTELMQALLNCAEQHLHTLMPDYTYLQTAQPTTLAHYLLTFVQPQTRDLERLQLAFSHANRSPAGIGSTNGSRLPISRERLAELLGFPALALHTRDAMWQPDSAIEVMSVLTALLMNVDRLAEDLQLWATAEFGFVELADRHARISVIMPQKKNPYALAYVRGFARDSIGKLVSAATTQATPSGQIDNRIFVYGGVPQALDQTVQALQLMTGVIEGLRFNTEQLQQRARQQHSGATDLADVITEVCGFSARDAHRIVGRAVRLANERNSALNAALLDEVTQGLFQRPLGLSDAQIAQCNDPQQIVDTRRCSGGTAVSAMRPMIAQFRQAASLASHWQAAEQRRIAAAEQALLQQVRERCQHT